MLVRGRDCRDTYDRFRWQIPDRFNIGADTVDRHADGSNRLALRPPSKPTGPGSTDG